MAESEHAAFEEDFSDYYDKRLPAARAAEVEAHLAGCARCRAEYERFQQAVDAVSGLHHMAAPQRFEEQVAETIHRRSAGRFFGRKAFGDRVPFEVLALVALILAAAIVVLLRWSSSGSVHEPLEDPGRAAPVAPAPPGTLPRP